MSTCYILPRDRIVTRAQVRNELECVVSDDDDAKGLTVASPNVNLGISYDGEYAWISFTNDVVASLSTYGHSSRAAVDLFGRTFNLTPISEHDDEFSYHEFPVDVHTTIPYAERDDWQLFLSDGWLYLYNAKTDTYYSHICREVNDFSFDDMIAEAD